MSRTKLEDLAAEAGILFDEARDVLLVDDDPNIGQVLGPFVERRDIDLTSVETAERALELLEELTPGVALVDVNLPGMDGLELTRRIRERWPDILVIVVTGEAGTEALLSAMRSGAHDYLLKPFVSFDLIAERIKATLEVHNERRRAQQLADFLVEANSGLRRAHEEIESAQAEIEMFNRILEAKVEQRAREHQAASAQLDALRTGMGVVRGELDDVTRAASEVLKQVSALGAAQVEQAVLGCLVDLKRTVRRLEALVPSQGPAGIAPPA